MLNNELSRRTFLKGTAATTALAAAGGLVLGPSETPAMAAEEGEVKKVSSLCNGCSSKCGLVATVKDGRLETVEGHKVHPYSKGKLCGRGHGIAQAAYTDSRLTQPVKRMADGTFEAISWETAYAEIGERVKAIIAEKGPEALAMVHDPRPSGKFYADRFIKTLGSPNIYTHGAACNLSKEAGLHHVIGGSNFSVDFGNAKMVVFIGRSYGDGLRPSSVKSLADAVDRGCKVITVDPRLNSSAIFADEWVPIKPGCDIALLLGICNVLVSEDLYDHEFIEKNTLGFEDFAAQVEQYTPEWAESVCGVPADTVARLARDLAAAAPAAAIEASWRAAFGCAYQNSFETARCVAAVNALLGCWNRKGGALMTSSPKAGKLDAAKFPEVPKPEGKRYGDAEYPLVFSKMGSNLMVAQGLLDGDLAGVFFYNSNAAQGYSQPKVWHEALGKADLVVTIDVQMSETALESDYVLPECSYLERLELPEFIGGKKHFVGLRNRALDLIHPDTKPCDVIFTELAEACGVGDYFQFTVEELAQAQLESVGTSLEQAKEEGVVALKDPGFTYGEVSFSTPSGLFEFSSEAVGAAGRNPVIGYMPRLVEPGEGEFYLVGGKQSIHSHTMTLNMEYLNSISREYNMQRAWISAQDAEKLGVVTGDLIEMSSSEHTATIEARVTQRVMPGVVFLPSHYGNTSSQLERANGFGVNINDFVPFHLEPEVGAAMSQEVVVTLKKAGA